ncbi:MAG: AIR synthase-related protein [Anaerolineales bacterium]
MERILPVGKLDMAFLSSLLGRYTDSGEGIAIGAKVGEDAAVLDFGDRYLVTKTNPITFPTDEIGWYLVNVCVNNMVVRGVRPRWMLNCILLPEGKTTSEMVEGIFRQIHEASRAVDVMVVGGHTEVTHNLDRPIVVGHLIGDAPRDALVATGGARVGDAVLVTKAVGIEGTSIIARELQDGLIKKGISENLILRAQQFLYDPGIGVYHEALAAAETGWVNCMTDATEGGLATALHELAEAGEVGVRIEAEKIPVVPETREICQAYGLDPIGLIASGMLILTAGPARVDGLRQRLGALGVACAPIGVVTPSDEGRLLVNQSDVSALPYFAVDELTKIL